MGSLEDRQLAQLSQKTIAQTLHLLCKPIVNSSQKMHKSFWCCDAKIYPRAGRPYPPAPSPTVRVCAGNAPGGEGEKNYWGQAGAPAVPPLVPRPPITPSPERRSPAIAAHSLAGESSAASGGEVPGHRPPFGGIAPRRGCSPDGRPGARRIVPGNWPPVRS